MGLTLAAPGRLDRLAIGLSGLCAVHCIVTAVLLAILSSAGGLLGLPIIHESGLALAMILGATALGRGSLQHGFLLPISIGALGLGVMAGAMTYHESALESVYTIIGVAILALGHRLNCLAAE